MVVEENFLYVRAENSEEDDDSSLNDETFINDFKVLTNLTVDDALKKMESVVKIVEMTESDVSDKEESSTMKKHDKGEVKLKEEKECKPKDMKQHKLKEKKKHNMGWFVGAHCRTKYSVDNVVYEADIIQINAEEGTCCVKYVGYNNEEDVKLESLKLSKGEAARNKQFATAAQYRTWNYNGDVTNGEETYSSIQNNVFANSEEPGPPNYHGSSSSFVPPQVSSVCGNLSDHEDSGVISAMLMSWYMSGYHTGYYQGLKDGKPK